MYFCCVFLFPLYVVDLEYLNHCFGGIILLVSTLFLWSLETVDSCSNSHGREKTVIITSCRCLNSTLVKQTFWQLFKVVLSALVKKPICSYPHSWENLNSGYMMELWCYCLTQCHGLSGDTVIYSLGNTPLSQHIYM